VSRFIYYYAECLYADCLHADCLYADCLYADCRYANVNISLVSGLSPSMLCRNNLLNVDFVNPIQQFSVSIKLQGYDPSVLLPEIIVTKVNQKVKAFLVLKCLN
jgi:hypothetical protein